MSRIVLCGEAVVDFVPARLADGTEAFVCRPGGSPFNIAKAAALAGAEAHFFGGLSTDMFGDRLLADLRSSGVGDTYVSRVAYPTMLAFVEFLDGQPRYTVLDSETATSHFDPWQTGLDAVAGGVLEVGSASLVYSPAADRIVDFTEAASAQAMIILDPNVRPGLIREPDEWSARIRRIMEVAAIVRLSIEDMAYMAPGISSREFAHTSIENGASCVVVTDGENGSQVFTRSAEVRVRAPRVTVVDTIGAGDVLLGTMLAWLLENGVRTREGLSSLGANALREMLAFASAAAAINCARRGCSPATRREIGEFLSESFGQMDRGACPE